MDNPFVPDFTAANADLDELTALARLHRFDLFKFLSLFSEAGAPTFCCEVNDEPAIATGRRIVRYKLSDGLLAVLQALRARHVDEDHIEVGPGAGRASAGRGPSSHLVTSP